MSVKGFLIKSRARFSKKRPENNFKTKIARDDMEKLQKMEKSLENVSEKIQEEIEEIEQVENFEKSKKDKFGWLKGGMTRIALQDFVGASMGAVFFGLSQEVWDMAAKMTLYSLISIFFISLLLSFLLVYLSRRRKTIAARIYHTTLLRGFEIYTVSFVTSLIFVLVLGISYDLTSLVNQTVLITLAATISAGTADLLFY